MRLRVTPQALDRLGDRLRGRLNPQTRPTNVATSYPPPKQRGTLIAAAPIAGSPNRWTYTLVRADASEITAYNELEDTNTAALVAPGIRGDELPPTFLVRPIGSVRAGASSPEVYVATDVDYWLDNVDGGPEGVTPRWVFRETNAVDGTCAAGGGGGGPPPDGDYGDIAIAGGVWSIKNNAVDNAALAQVPTGTVKGRVDPATGDATDLSSAQLTTLVNTFTPSTKGLVSPSGGGSTSYLRADGWATLPPTTPPAVREGINYQPDPTTNALGLRNSDRTNAIADYRPDGADTRTQLIGLDGYLGIGWTYLNDPFDDRLCNIYTFGRVKPVGAGAERYSIQLAICGTDWSSGGLAKGLAVSSRWSNAAAFRGGEWWYALGDAGLLPGGTNLGGLNAPRHQGAHFLLAGLAYPDLPSIAGSPLNASSLLEVVRAGDYIVQRLTPLVSAWTATRLFNMATSLWSSWVVTDNRAPTPRPTNVGGVVGLWTYITAGVGAALVLPSGGTWAYFATGYVSPANTYYTTIGSVAAGGATIGAATANVYWSGLVWKVA